MLAAKGDKARHALITDTDQITGKIQSIDADKHTITFTQADGTAKTVKAGQKVNLSDLKPGDDITARVTQAARRSWSRSRNRRGMRIEALKRRSGEGSIIPFVSSVAAYLGAQNPAISIAASVANDQEETQARNEDRPG